MPVGHNLRLRLFIEGVEVPVISAYTPSQKNVSALCSIQIPANDYAMDLMQFSLIHLYSYDIYNGAPPDEAVSVGGPGIRTSDRDDGVDPDIRGLYPPERWESTPEQSEEDLINEGYKLHFGGELYGFSFQKTPTSRCIVLQCVDWSRYWDHAFQYQVSGYSLGQGGVRAAFTGASTSVFNDFLEGSGDIVAKLLETPPRSYPSLKGTLMGGLMHLIEAIGGVYFGKRSIRGLNDYFSLAEMRLHLTQMIGANPYSNRDEQRLLTARGFGSLFRRNLAGLGKQVTVRQVLLALQRYIFHEIIPITSPRYLPALHDPSTPQYESLGIEQDPETLPLAKAARQVKQRASEMNQRQQASTDNSSSLEQSRLRGGLGNELKRLSDLCDEAARRSRKIGIQGGNNTRLADFFSIADVTQVFASAAASFSRLREITANGNPAQRGSSFHIMGTAGADSTLSILGSVEASMQLVLDSKHRRRVQRQTQQPDPPPRLLTQIYRPDVWMVAPPRCNVFFPELYSQFSYNRNFQQEVTRLMLRTHSAFFGSDQLFDGYYMAPSKLLGQRTGRVPGRGRVGAEPSDYADAPAWFAKDMLEHELYTGIIPSFERMSDLNLHALRGGSIDINGVKVGYAQLAANHLFFQYRFKSRELTLSGKFNPYAVLGFPALVIDKYLPVDHLRDGEYDAAVAAKLAEAVREGKGEFGSLPTEEQARVREANTARVNEVVSDLLAERPNTHFLGTPAMVAHNISATAGGTTQIQMEYSRTTNERTEFMGDNLGRGARARRKKNQNIRTEVASLSTPVLGSKGPRGGRIVSVVDTTDASERRTLTGQARGTSSPANRGKNTERLLPLYTGDAAFNGRRRRGTRVVVGVERPASSYGEEVIALVGSGGTFDASTQQILVTFRSFSVVEEIGVYVKEDVSLPPEDYTFPPWYGETYRTNRIGSLYAYFFGIGAITDPITFTEPGVRPPVTIPQSNEEALRTTTIAFLRKFSESLANANAVAGFDQRPAPGYENTPNVAGGTMGPPGNPESESLGDAAGLIGSIKERSPIGEAVEELVRVYSRAKLDGYDVHEFIRSYTWRPIASMVDMFGTSNLEITDAGETVRGREGFHSRAFGDFDDLRQLVSPSDGVRPQTILGVSTRSSDETGDSVSGSKDTRIASRLDTRKEKRIRVLKYLNALMASRGILG